MNFETQEQAADRELWSLNAVSPTRRHVYFYILLLLGTMVAHNMRHEIFGDDGAEFATEQAALRDVSMQCARAAVP